ncbi:hypothetical protein BDZ91DRAFT_729398 [Kalaharituber pfeilii]|nr:hypothetical protein BDZ91DRAFT_729398 [Kalaharituber pfeilii]
MKTTFVLATLAAAVAVQAQLPQVPQCAVRCTVDAVSNPPAGCESGSIKCICENDAFIAGVSVCVQAACDEQGLQDTIKGAYEFCRSAGAELNTVLPTSSTPTPTVTPTGTSGNSTGNGTTSGTPSTTSANESGAAQANSVAQGVGLAAAAFAAVMLL